MLLGLADGAFLDRYDYSVTIVAVLRRGSHSIGTYEATGKYRCEVPENEPGAGRESEARTLAWEHALGLLAAKMKADRNTIVQRLAPRE